MPLTKVRSGSKATFSPIGTNKRMKHNDFTITGNILLFSITSSEYLKGPMKSVFIKHDFLVLLY